MRLIAVLALALVACRTGPGRPEPAACDAVAGPAGTDTIRITVPDSVDLGHAPHARNEAEQLVFRQAFRGSCRVGVTSTTDHGVTVARPGRAVLAFDWARGTDARDLLDGGAAAVLTGDPSAIEYAAARPDLTTIPLPWSRTYVFVLKSGGSVTWAEGPAVWRDAIRGEAQPTAPPFWWRSASCAHAPTTTPAPPGAVPRMVYLQGDENARGLAERFVARGASLAPRERRERIVPVTAAELAAAAASGADYAVVALPREPANPCEILGELGVRQRPAREVIPMLDTRLHLIVRRGRFGVSIGGDGIPHFDP